MINATMRRADLARDPYRKIALAIRRATGVRLPAARLWEFAWLTYHAVRGARRRVLVLGDAAAAPLALYLATLGNDVVAFGRWAEALNVGCEATVNGRLLGIWRDPASFPEWARMGSAPFDCALVIGVQSMSVAARQGIAGAVASVLASSGRLAATFAAGRSTGQAEIDDLFPPAGCVLVGGPFRNYGDIPRTVGAMFWDRAA